MNSDRRAMLIGAADIPLAGLWFWGVATSNLLLLVIGIVLGVILWCSFIWAIGQP